LISVDFLKVAQAFDGAIETEVGGHLRDDRDDRDDTRGRREGREMAPRVTIHRSGSIDIVDRVGVDRAVRAVAGREGGARRRDHGDDGDE
jgi:hypothetical protein